MKEKAAQKPRIVYLKFPAERSGRPLICNLIRLHDLVFNILQAHILPRGEGRMTLELIGSEKNYTSGIAYLKEQGITVEHVAQKIFKDDELCIQCGLCTSLCQSRALAVDKTSREIIFTSEICTACGQCLRVCPVGAMSTKLEDNEGH